ncbi:MAG: hypothetical protein ACYC0E_06270 [Acidimicrobiales bacterium]
MITAEKNDRTGGLAGPEPEKTARWFASASSSSPTVPPKLDGSDADTVPIAGLPIARR